MHRLGIGLLLALATVACSATAEPVAATTTTLVVSTPASSVRSSPVPSSPAGVTVPVLTAGTATSTRRSVTTPASSTNPQTSAPPADCAQAALSKLTEAQRIGQLLMVGIPADELASAPALLGRLPVGGVFLAGRSTAGSAEVSVGIASIQAFATKAAGVRLHIAVDQEGGYVQSLQGADFPAIPTAVEQGQESSADLVAATKVWASALVTAGITLDLAPVADVVPAGTADQNPPIGREDRQYGSTPESVAASVSTVVKAMLAAKLGTTVKHFPGLGRVTANTDTSTGAQDPDTTANDASLQPFQRAIAAGTTAVMISSASYPQLDPDNIAAFSEPIITGLLRKTLHFDGLVISDDLGGAVAVGGTPIGQRAVDFIRAGGDLVLTVKPADVPTMTDALAREVITSTTFRARVDEAALHVLRSKQNLGILAC